MNPNPDTSKQSSGSPYGGFRPRMFALESMLFLAVQFIGLWAGWSMLNRGYADYGETGSSIVMFLLAFLFATVIIIILLKFLKGALFFKALMAFLIFVGAETIFAVPFPDIVATLLAILLVIIHFRIANVLTQNIAMIIAVGGIGASLGMFLPVPAIIVILLVLSLYDYIAVYRTKHMVKMFRGLLDKGVPMSLVVPDKASGMSHNVKLVTPGTGKYLMLGTGDIAFPVIFAVSALNYSLLHALGVVVGSFLGLVVVHYIVTMRAKGAVPALPPISILAILGFALVHFIGGL
jgi:presenilin-like A22 family membrane protease